MNSPTGPDAKAAVTITPAEALPLLEPLTRLVAAAGAAILAARAGDCATVEKPDGSPVTNADLAADRILADGLARLRPDIPTLSEERTGEAASPFDGSFFLIDPLDGTKEFIAGRDEFTVNVALVTDGVPILGVVGAPALGLIWRGVVGHGAERVKVDGATYTVAPVRARPVPAPGAPWVAAVSRSHGDPRTDAFIASRPGAVRRTMGSALKLCRIADAEIDIYPRFAPTSEWDIAAGHAIVVAAGGRVTDAHGNPLRYGTGRENFILPDFIAWGAPSAPR